LEATIGKIVYYLLMLLVLVAVFQALQLTLVTQPLNAFLGSIFAYLPNLLAAGAIILLAWILASGLRFIVAKVLGATRLDDRLASNAGVSREGQPPLSETLASIVYWFILLLFLPAVVGALNIPGLLIPIQAMIAIVLTYLPNFLAAALILVIGWVVARIVRIIVTNFLAAVGTDRLGARIGLQTEAGPQSLSGLIGTIIYVLILIPVIISALQALQIEAISAPATAMLARLLGAIPNIFGAMIILGVTYFVARLVSGLVVTLLTSIGFNRVLGLIGLGDATAQARWTPADVVGYLVLIGLMLFATIEAAELLGFTMVAALVTAFLYFAGQIILGVVILGIGLFLASVARRAVLGLAGEHAVLLSRVAYAAVVILTVFMGLRQMGIAEDIINLAFGLLLGALAVAFALAFGLGSREIAAREVESVLDRWRAGEGR
ncbi:MAG TPA: mechanosensitive ion channel, partial [Anaerolineae bacterium]|nr:mechanosensitive ion channel [Anaerolineae bacterium]